MVAQIPTCPHPETVGNPTLMFNLKPFEFAQRSNWHLVVNRGKQVFDAGRGEENESTSSGMQDLAQRADEFAIRDLRRRRRRGVGQ